jgi:hypothetical protein
MIMIGLKALYELPALVFYITLHVWVCQGQAAYLPVKVDKLNSLYSGSLPSYMMLSSP